MLSPTRTLLIPALIVATNFLGFGASTTLAQAGSYGGYTSGWSGYAPGYTWGSYVPNGYVRVAPAPSPTAAWPGYAPATAWQGYQPGVAWQGYTPGRVVTGYATPPGWATVSRPSATTIGRQTGYREFGSGRPVFLHKPWLPGH